MKVGRQRDFYGDPGPGTVDDRITQMEGEWAQELQALRAVECGSPIAPEFPSAFCAHLSIRTRHVRRSAQDAIEGVVDKVRDNLDSPDRFAMMVLKAIEDEPELLLDPLRTQLAQRFPAADPRARDEALMDLLQYLPIADLLAASARETYPEMDATLSAVKGHLPNSLRSGHCSALARDLAPEPRVEPLSGLAWQIEVWRDRCLVLGDSGPVAMTQEGEFRPLSWAGNEIDQVILPISATHLLVGSRSPGRRLAADEVNAASIAVSHESELKEN